MHINKVMEMTKRGNCKISSWQLGNFNPDKNIELLTRKFYSRKKIQVTNWRIVVQIKISSD